MGYVLGQKTMSLTSLRSLCLYQNEEKATFLAIERERERERERETEDETSRFHNHYRL
jgi:hypothetical protein